MSGKVGPGKSASVVTENPERVTVGKSRRGRETNSESLLFGKERIWCPERRNHLSEAYGQQTKSRDSNPSLEAFDHPPRSGNRTAELNRSPLTPQERGYFEDPSGKKSPGGIYDPCRL